MQMILIFDPENLYFTFTFNLPTNIFISEIIFYSGFKDQDYRTGPNEEKPSKLIRLSGVPENATKEEVRLFFSFSFSFFCQLNYFYFLFWKINRFIGRCEEIYREILGVLPAMLTSCITIAQWLNQQIGFGAIHRPYLDFSSYTFTHWGEVYDCCPQTCYNLPLGHNPRARIGLPT